ncbi:hypothetical protein NP493_743g02004 [Ridgeia piscesae]|uniref:Uncharacterized protein n=1 Tax=Ridgeia piscesae TaxID=27915 RepID=A0AAD9KPW5_RIDPI|nr:hypothetical protein NP493_743g02004 [Ridgeia piscesae]
MAAVTDMLSGIFRILRSRVGFGPLSICRPNSSSERHVAATLRTVFLSFNTLVSSFVQSASGSHESNIVSMVPAPVLARVRT